MQQLSVFEGFRTLARQAATEQPVQCVTVLHGVPPALLCATETLHTQLKDKRLESRNRLHLRVARGECCRSCATKRQAG